jgi:hypothetical protein
LRWQSAIASGKERSLCALDQHICLTGYSQARHESATKYRTDPTMNIVSFRQICMK